MKLKSLMPSLSDYQKYFQMYSNDKIINLRLKDEIDLSELNIYICALMNELLLIHDDNLPYDEKKKVVEFLYEVVYKAIKLEFVKSDFSELYDFCCKNDIPKFLFNDLIKKDIENIELPNKTKKELDLKILEIEK